MESTVDADTNPEPQLPRANRADEHRAPFAVIEGPDGRRFSTDQHRHCLLIDKPSGERIVVGRPGTGPGEFQYPRGLACLPNQDEGSYRVFVCDSWNHRVQIFSQDGQLRGMFGSCGSGSGQFDTPLDIVVVSPRFAGEYLVGVQGVMLAVAERWNGRVQILEPDGVPLAVLGDGRRTRSNLSGTDDTHDRAAWPFFRLTSVPELPLPTRLAWQDPYLEVIAVDGSAVQIDLAVALLPDFENWRRTASRSTLRAAATTLGKRARSTHAALRQVVEVIEDDLARLERSLLIGKATARLKGMLPPRSQPQDQPAAKAQHVGKPLSPIAVWQQVVTTWH